jgi:apolipoprotein N-acyltransferase
MGFLPVVQIAAVLGAPAIVFLFSLFASTAAVALYRGRGISRPWLGYGLAAAILLSALGWGAFRLRAAVAEPSVKVGLVAVDDFVRPGIPPGRIWDAYDQAVRELAAESAHIVVLPEKIFWLTPDEAAERRKQFAALARETGVYLVVGLQLNEPDRNRNVSWLFIPSGDLAAEYDKQHMVPYLESDLRPGRENVVRRIDGEPYGLVICRDMFFTDLGRAYSRLGVAALLIPAWDFYVDAWWASRVAALRGVENGYSVVRASRESFLALSDRYGHILAQKRSAKLPGASMLATLPLGPATPTPYARFGDVFGWVCVAGAVLAVLLPRRAPEAKKPSAISRQLSAFIYHI